MSAKEAECVIDFVGDTGFPERLCFRNPLRTVVARDKDEVADALLRVEDEVRRGLFAAGFIAYEAASAFNPTLQTLSCSSFPLVWFGIYTQPHDTSQIELGEYDFPERWLPEISRTEFDSSIDTIQRNISEGATYQANFTFRFRTKFAGNPFAFYEHLRKVHPVPYGAYFNIGDHAIISNSPELFISFSDGRITTQPMKGTVARGRHGEEDSQRHQELAASEKDRAEHIMIVDLMRSDLSKIAASGPVEVSDMFDLLPLATVWQMTSKVSCNIDRSTRLLDIMRAAFPPGSVTGAPKPKTMEILASLETSPRKVYCGALGYLSPEGSGCFSVPIRTIIVDNDTMEAECGVGGGITSGSIAAAEYEEALTKARFLDSRLFDFDLLESMLLESGNYFLFSEHLDRLISAAKYFGYTIDSRVIERRLLAHAAQFKNGRRKVRLTVTRSGSSTISSEPIHELGSQRVALASSPIDVDTPFVYHKTTYREQYNRFKREHPSCYDVLLWNNQGSLTEFVNGNVVLELDGVRYTPSIESGLLPGTFRRHLLAGGDVLERDLKLADIPVASGIWLINSVRRWVSVQLLDD